MEKPVRSLTIISAHNCIDRLDLLREAVKESLDNDRITILYSAGMPSDQVYSVTENLHGAAARLHTRNDVNDVHGLVIANLGRREKTHIIVGKPVSYEPTASVVNLGGLTIPIVTDERLSAAFKLVEFITICTVE